MTADERISTLVHIAKTAMQLACDPSVPHNGFVVDTATITNAVVFTEIYPVDSPANNKVSIKFSTTSCGFNITKLNASVHISILAPGKTQMHSDLNAIYDILDIDIPAPYEYMEGNEKQAGEYVMKIGKRIVEVLGMDYIERLRTVIRRYKDKFTSTNFKITSIYNLTIVELQDIELDPLSFVDYYADLDHYTDYKNFSFIPEVNRYWRYIRTYAQILIGGGNYVLS